jgi:uncharacterized protein
MKIQAFAAGSITESITAFSQMARSNGLNVGIQETVDALAAADLALLSNRNQFKAALKTIFCTSPEERDLFDMLFISFWDTNPLDLKERKNKTSLQGTVVKKANASLVMLGKGKTGGETAEGKNVSGANEKERLQKTDFSKVNDIDADQLEAIAQKLFREMALRLRRRMKNNRRSGQINLRRTIRRSIGYGGEPVELFRKSQKQKKQRLIVLLDVSGSMDKYSFYLLRFICALSENFRQLEAFVFSTSLIRITKAINVYCPEATLAAISEKANNWSGGTKIGDSFSQFNEKYGKRFLNGSPSVIILSDGLETGDAELLKTEMRKIQSRVKRIVWLNPLKGMKGYEPLAKGMSAALPMVDQFSSAHSLESLLELETILVNA